MPSNTRMGFDDEYGIERICKKRIYPQKEEEIADVMYEFGEENQTITIDIQEDLGSEGEDYIFGAVTKPDEAIAMAEVALEDYAKELSQELDGISTSNFPFESLGVRLKNIGEDILVRNIRTTHINKLISINATISKATKVSPKVTQAAYECLNCGEYSIKRQFSDYLQEPNQCKCESGRFKIDYSHNATEFMNSQEIKIQERPSNLDGGERPEDITVRATGDLCGMVSPGDKVTITGILRVLEPSQNDETRVRDTFIEGVNIEIEDKDVGAVELDEEDKKKVKELVNSTNNPLNLVTNNISPSIKGYQAEKRAIAMQLFGGVPKTMPDGTKLRGDIHVLLIGDPGTAKSSLLEFANKISPRSVFTSGKGASAAGLTASAVRDDFGSGEEWTLEAGALVLADKGLAAVDELDKMSRGDRMSMNGALEQQEVKINKAGINAKLKTRCSLLAAANPKEGRYHPHEPLDQQFNLDPTLISRFDLIFTVQDNPDEDKDFQIGGHIVDRHIQSIKYDEEGEVDENSEVVANIDEELLRKYIAYARQNCRPQITEDAKEKMVEYYVDVRTSRDDEEDAIPITARKMEALVRLSEAVARIELEDVVTERHAKIAVDTVKATIEDVGIDPETGEIDANRLRGGQSHGQKQKKEAVIDIIYELKENDEDGEYENGIPSEDIKKELEKHGFNTGNFTRYMSNLAEKEHRIFEPANSGKFMPMN